MNTKSLHLLVGLHKVFGAHVVESKARNIIESIDKDLHGGEVAEELLWSVAPGRAEGLAFRVLKQGERWSDNGRRGWVFTYPVEQEARFDAAMEEAKKRKEWAKLWGRFAFTIKMVMPPRREEPLEDTVRRPGYQAIMRKVGSAQLCMGCCIIGGLSNIDKKFRLRMYDNDGNLVEIIERRIREL